MDDHPENQAAGLDRSDEDLDVPANRPDLRDHLLSGPRCADFDIPRLMDTGRPVDLGE
jgi:hypothetical protein